MRRLWACVVAKLEDNHARRTVMANARANARANAARGIELVPFQEMPAGWTPPHAGLDWFPVAPPIPVETDTPPTDFDG
jgi:hypothetical protein